MTQDNKKIFNSKLVAFLGFLGAAIAPSIEFISGYWEYQLKKQEVEHQIALDFAKLALQEEVSREYQRNMLEVISSIPRNPLEVWANIKLQDEKKIETDILNALYERARGVNYQSFEACTSHLAGQLKIQEIVLSENLKKKDIEDTIDTAISTKDDYIERVKRDCERLGKDEKGIDNNNNNCSSSLSPQDLREESLSRIFVNAKIENIQKYLPLLQEGMLRKEISSCERMAMFLAIIGFESREFQYVEELQPEVIYSELYEGRLDLGNTQPGDGARFKGRGLFLIVGRKNYQEFANYVNRPDILSNPDVVASEAFLALETALWYWERRDLNKVADNGDLRGIIRRVNGGYSGYEEIQRLYETAKAQL